MKKEPILPTFKSQKFKKSKSINFNHIINKQIDKDKQSLFKASNEFLDAHFIVIQG